MMTTEPQAKPKNTKTMFALPEDMLQAVREQARREERSMSAIVRRALTLYFETVEKEGNGHVRG